MLINNYSDNDNHIIINNKYIMVILVLLDPLILIVLLVSKVTQIFKFVPKMFFKEKCEK